MIEGFFGSDSLTGIDTYHFSEQVQEFSRGIGNKVFNADSLNGLKIKFEMRGLFGKFIQQPFIRSAQHTKNSRDLIDLTFSRKERILGKKLKKHAPHTPNIHLFRVVAISHQTLRRPIPPRRNVLSMRPRRMQV